MFAPGNARRPWRFLPLLLLPLHVGAVARAQTSVPLSPFTVRVELSPAAARTLAARHEGIVVSAGYTGAAKPSAQKHADQMGQINLGYDRVTVAGTSGTVRVPGTGLRRAALVWVQGPVLLNVNVYTARQSSPDNLLSCDFFDGELQHAVQSPMTLHCGLITENPKTTYLQ